MPRRIAASTQASAISAQYAGPTPEQAAQASMMPSGTRTTAPTRPNSSSTSPASGSSAGSASSVTPRPTSAGVFGCTRTTGTSG